MNKPPRRPGRDQQEKAAQDKAAQDRANAQQKQQELIDKFRQKTQK